MNHQTADRIGWAVIVFISVVLIGSAIHLGMVLTTQPPEPTRCACHFGSGTIVVDSCE